MKNWLLAIGGIGVLAIAAVIVFVPSENTQEAALAEPVSVSVAELTWDQVDDAIRSLAGSRTGIDQTVDAIGADASPASRYLRGLLQLSLGDVTSARQDFRSIALHEYPPRFLYAPFRLEDATPAAGENRYLKPLRQYALDGNVEGLQRGRVLSRTGDFEAALEGYLASNPSRWRSFDVESFSLLMAQPGLESSVRSAIASAAAHIRPEIYRSLLALSDERQRPDARKSFIERVIHHDKDLAVNVVRQLMETRRAFVQGEFERLVDTNRHTDPLHAGDELCLLVFVSAVAADDRFEADRWGQELRRRFNDEETQAWIRSLISEIG